jgi:hypothetical protein
MDRPMRPLLLLTACASLVCLAPQGQAQKKITVRVLDGKIGDKITPDNFEVRINRQQANHLEWVKVNDDGTATLTLPDNATALWVRATYANSTEYYVNCDMAKQKNTSADSWYPVGDIVSEGIVIQNECARGKDADKVKTDPKPGEFVLFVRKRNWKEQALQ